MSKKGSISGREGCHDKQKKNKREFTRRKAATIKEGGSVQEKKKDKWLVVLRQKSVHSDIAF
jgi:hypothetical protein